MTLAWTLFGAIVGLVGGFYFALRAMVNYLTGDFWKDLRGED